MKDILVAAAVALVVSILLTPYLIKVFSRQGFGQEIREEAPEGHKSKRGTPTMGGVAILLAMWAGYAATHLTVSKQGPTASGLLVLMLTSALGLVGFLDDFIKIRKQRNLGLNKTAKLVGQFAAAVIFAILVIRFPDERDLTPASTHLSFVRDIAVISFGTVGFIVFCYLAVSAWSNAVNFTDGMDGLAAGSSAMVLAGYVLVAFWQYRYDCGVPGQFGPGCYNVRDPLDLAVVAAAAMAGCIGFLWWNAAPAKIFMGDTGSLALGGLVAGLSMTTRTEMLMIVLGGLFVVEALSVVLQIAVFRTTRRRLFRMAPFHHHFELAGWAETTIIIRFWLMAGICVLFGLGLFYSEWADAAGIFNG
ncbi:Phospho-N-acetylmuramoyl-pentapeptide-transferase [Streptoalloteichus tenebrarius]|uniref:Phospho-N-acetylmuramoyl-pentapeptide-transferase n=1 Tax=Streptoalloteichus tenebrarius (strain ATCC 17920 / DSM 40477 / JCM 4838 / CBS 697.72 / NBRC 16177 / NCIMB 11028 / NRRL B-12390 / A12253. 1 / ISP 5477) TaxID=1933 RepID=A0ABT1HN68_STRSD|nr:phospho-N-acetylmuramoyl-pentapeptide-transferase [Streptoalloteichus tenebrarius]MCP2256962.1 Phospho-N-acetylmuramoyl-pentapeptide-transferase [Streptoalloteichus tenebrarius]BFF00127.1 phospho-N-acetylmuramoyl-pentapeptide-transferase [Streptoalloteichus tenebrarius]